MCHHFDGRRQLFEAVFTREVEGCHLCETAMVVARADDQKAAHRQAVGEVGTVLDGLAISARFPAL